VPAITQSDGNEKSETNRQVLEANQSSEAAATELGQRAGDDFAAKQSNPVLSVTYPDSYRWMIPSVSQWYTHTIAASENTRGRAYDTNTRWLTSNVDIEYDLATQRRVVRVQHPIETTTLGFAVAVEEAPVPTQYSVPVQPVMDTYPGFISETFGSDLPSGATADDEQPVTQDDIAPQSEAQDPQITINIIEKTSGQTIMVWNDDNIWRTDTIGQLSGAVWDDSKWETVGTGTLQDAVWDGGDDVGAAAFAVSNDGTDTYSYSTTNVAKAFWLATDTIDTFEASIIRQQSTDTVMVYGIAGQFEGGSFTIDQLNGNGTAYLQPSNEDSTHGGATPSNAPGVYCI
jgi:hypothetical protein